MVEPDGVRLQKVLSQAGIASRRVAERMILDGRVEVDGRIVGAQRMCLLDAGTAWHLSAVRQHAATYQTHVVRLLRHTRLERIQWINLDQRTVTLRTLTHDSAINDSVVPE